jgi:RNA polymerase sigma-70 factor, ECF subfamily
MRQLPSSDTNFEPLGRNVGQDFNLLHEYYHESIKRYLVAKRLVHDQDQAEDICQETYMILWKCLLRQDKSLPQTVYQFKSWLYTTATNRAIDKLRRNKLIVFQSLEDEAHTQYPALMLEGVEDGVIDRHSDEEAIAAIAKEIAKLPPKQQASVKLRYIDGLTEKEAAAKLGITPKTVSANASRGIEKVRSKVYPVLVDMRDVKIPYLVQECIRIYRGWDMEPCGVIFNDKERQLQSWYRNKMDRLVDEILEHKGKELTIDGGPCDYYIMEKDMFAEALTMKGLDEALKDLNNRRS